MNNFLTAFYLGGGKEFTWTVRMIGEGSKDFRWGGKVRCNTWSGKARCNSAAKSIHLLCTPLHIEKKWRVQSRRRLYLVSISGPINGKNLKEISNSMSIHQVKNKINFASFSNKQVNSI